MTETFLERNLIFLRKDLRKTQDDLSKILNMSRSTLNSYENGSIKNPTLKALNFFSNHFQFLIDDLIKRDLDRAGELKRREMKETFKLLNYNYEKAQLPVFARES